MAWWDRFVADDDDTSVQDRIRRYNDQNPIYARQALSRAYGLPALAPTRRGYADSSLSRDGGYSSAAYTRSGEPPNQRRTTQASAQDSLMFRDMANDYGRSSATPERVGDPAPDQNAEDAFLQQMMDELMNAPMSDGSDISAAYDQQLDAARGMFDVINSSGSTATGAIGNYFGYAGEQAEQARGAVDETYGAATDRVGGIYDEGAERIAQAPQDVVASASQAAGGRIGASTADEAALAAASFAASAEAERAGALSDVERRSAAGQNYLSQLAAATSAEGAQYQSDVEQRMALANVAAQQQMAQIEAQKAQAMAQYSQDAARDQYERMLDVLQLQDQFTQRGLQRDQLELQRDQFDLEREQFEQGGAGGVSLGDQKTMLEIQAMTDPYAVGGRRGANMLFDRAGDDGDAQMLFDSILSEVQSSPTEAGRVLSEEEMLARGLESLGNYTTEAEQPSNPFGFLPWVEDERDPVGAGGRDLYGGDAEDLEIVQEALRIMYGQ